jgi:tetratricopeptide (TPR) repeat protein
MNMRAWVTSIGACAAALWKRITDGRVSTRSMGDRRTGFQGLYWTENIQADRDDASYMAVHGQEEDAGSADYWYMRGELLVQQERFADANDCFEQALHREPLDLYALVYKGYCLYKLGYYEMALAVLQQASLIEPRHPEIDIVRSLCLCRLHRFEDALNSLSRALRGGLESSILWNNKGFCLFWLGRYREASAAFKTALSKCGAESPEILCNAASALVELGEIRKALKIFNKVLRISEEDPVLLNNAGYCMESLGRYDQALKCYQKALALDPASIPSLYNQGLCLVRLKQWDRACECLEEVVRRDPGNSIAWCGLAAASFARGNRDEAFDFYNKSFASVG